MQHFKERLDEVIKLQPAIKKDKKLIKIKKEYIEYSYIDNYNQ